MKHLCLQSTGIYIYHFTFYFTNVVSICIIFGVPFNKTVIPLAFVKGEGHSKKLTFLSLPIANKHSAFPLTEVSASEVPAILKKFVSKEVTSETTILKLSWQPGCVYVMSFCPTQNWQEGEKPATDLASFTIYFFSSNYPHHYLQLEFGACLVLNNMAQEQP